MEQFTTVWTALDTRRKIIVGVAAVAVFAAVLGLARMASSPSMAMLYAGLDPGPAGEVLEALEAQGVTHEVRGGVIYVDAARRDSLRMTLAAEGLPANSAKGYELLDGLSGFGTTSQMFDAAYWRAKEGELARTIMAAPYVRSARVHIATPAMQGLRAQPDPTASVSVSAATGSISTAQAKALKYLVSSAVPGLSPESVSVIDARGGLVRSVDDPGAPGDPDDRARTLKQNVERLLEARVGPGNAVVELTLDTAREDETIRERIFDPGSRVAISTDTSETANTASESGVAGVTVASNLPSGGGDPGSSSNSNRSETRERVNYEVSETTREVRRGPGAIRRLTVAVLVNGIYEVNDTGQEVWSARSEDELSALRDLVAGAVGFDAARGDTITLRTMAFEPMDQAGTGAPPGLLARFGLDVMALAKALVLALVALVLGLFVLRPALLTRARAGDEGAAGTGAAADPGPAAIPALTGEIEDGMFDGGEMAVVSDFDLDDGSDLPPLGGEADPVGRLRRLIEERQAETVEILRGWMEDDLEETA